jgi:hypothetical protein
MSGHGRGDALAAGLALMPLLVGWALGSSFGVKVLVRRGMRFTVGGAFGLAFAGAALLAFAVNRGIAGPLALGAMALLGFGTGPAASSSLVAAQSSVAWQHRGAVTSAVYAVRTLGGSLAVAALGAFGAYASDAAAARFDAIAVLAFGAAAAILAMAPGAVGESREVAPAAAREGADAVPAE